MSAMKRAWFVIAAAVLLVGSSGVSWAQAAQAGFLAGLLEQLGKNGWTVEERNAFAAAAADVDWSQAEGADPEAVALALRLQARDQLRDRDRLRTQDWLQDQDKLRTREHLRLTDREQVEAALQLALMTREMKDAGFDEHGTAVATAAAMLNCLGDIKAWMEGGRHGELGQIIRTQVRAAIRTQVQIVARSQGAGAWAGDRQGSGPGAGASGGMQGAGGGPLSGHGGSR